MATGPLIHVSKTAWEFSTSFIYFVLFVLAYCDKVEPTTLANILYRFWKLLLVPIEGELG